jgi:hypothetical protein
MWPLLLELASAANAAPWHDMICSSSSTLHYKTAAAVVNACITDVPETEMWHVQLHDLGLTAAYAATRARHDLHMQYSNTHCVVQQVTEKFNCRSTSAPCILGRPSRLLQLPWHKNTCSRNTKNSKRK